MRAENIVLFVLCLFPILLFTLAVRWAHSALGGHQVDMSFFTPSHVESNANKGNHFQSSRSYTCILVLHAVLYFTLGPSETGKTTVLKQLKLLYGTKGLDAERQTYRGVVHLNVMKAIQGLVDGLQRSNIALENPENVEHLEFMARLEPTLKRYSIASVGQPNPGIARKITDAKAETDMFLEMVPAIKALWADGGIQKTYNTSTQINIQDSAK